MTEPEQHYPARRALVEALAVLGIEIAMDDEHAGRVMQELRRLGYRLRRLPLGDRLSNANPEQRNE